MLIDTHIKNKNLDFLKI